MRGAMVRAVTLATFLVVALGGSIPSSASARPTPPQADAPEASGALSTGQVDLRTITGGLSSPVGVTNAGDGSNRLFVVERRGTVRVVSGGDLQPGFFLDIRGNSQGGLTSGGEQGLLGLAFHPDFETNEKLFVYYTRSDGDLVIAEMTANAARTSANVSTLNPIIQPIEHSQFGNHNGGQLLFVGNNLYIFTGDGGSGGDPGENGQDTEQPARQGPAGHAEPERRGHASRATTRTSAAAATTRSGRSACATRGAPRATARTATCGSPTSARTPWRRSTASRGRQAA